MSILNDKTNGVKIREKRYISCEYTTTGREAVDDLILVGKVNYNAILRSIQVTSDTAYNGFSVDIVILNDEKEEITYGANNAYTLSKLKSDLDFTNVLTNSECIPTVSKFETIEEDIVGETGLTHYRELVFIALKVKTVPANGVSNVKILTDISFVENI